ncbi:MAG: hypothetical protein MJA82_04025 [Clostridia bacterium]|nr:hypothetical protein [Clostridia bacterium]
MHDTFLFKRISDNLAALCEKEKIKEITKVYITVNPDSHVTEDTLRTELQSNIHTLIDKNIEIIVRNKELEEMTAIIHRVEGKK